MIVTIISRESRARVVRDGSSHGEGEETSNRPKRRRAAVQRMCDGWREARRSLLLRVADVGFACARLAGSPVGVARPSSSSGARDRPAIISTAREGTLPRPASSLALSPVRARPRSVLCTSIYPSARDHPIPLASATYNGAHINAPSLMSLERGRLTRARVRFRWTHPSPHPCAVLSRVRTVPSRP